MAARCSARPTPPRAPPAANIGSSQQVGRRYRKGGPAGPPFLLYTTDRLSFCHISLRVCSAHLHGRRPMTTPRLGGLVALAILIASPAFAQASLSGTVRD